VMPMDVLSPPSAIADRSRAVTRTRSGRTRKEITMRPDKWDDVDSPVGAIELTDAELGYVVGGAQSGASVGCNTKTCTRGNSQNPCTDCQA
jgi:hypothetical protein